MSTEPAEQAGQQQEQPAELTAGDRLVALKSVYPILAAGGEQPAVLDLIRLAEYVATGRDFLDGVVVDGEEGGEG